MKKNLFFLIVSIFLAITANSQERKSDQIQTAVAVGLPLSSIPPCFCCDAAYNLPNPPQINLVGQTQPVCSCDLIKFSTLPCPGATFNWTVVDNFGNNIAVTGGNTNAITLNYTLAQQVATHATWISIKLIVCCGKNCVTNTFVVKLKPIPSTSFSYSINDNGTGGYTLTAAVVGYPVPAAPSNIWALQKANCPINPCDAGPGTLVYWATCISTFNVPNGYLVKPNCYRLYHYVNVCSTTCYGSNCWVYLVKCFQTADQSLLKQGNSDGQAKVCTPEMVREIEKLQNQKPENPR